MAAPTPLADPNRTAEPAVQHSPQWRSYVAWTGLVMAAFLPALLLHFRGQLASDHLNHFPITLALVAFLAYRDMESLPAVRFRRSVFGIALLAFAAFLVAASVWLRSGWVGTMAALFVWWGGVELLGGRDARRAWRPAAILSWMLLQLPFGLDRTLIIAMQKIASTMASGWLDLQQIANAVTGVVIRTPQNDYLVEEACSGVNSLFAAATVGLFWVLYQRYGWIRSAIFLAVVACWVVLTNAVRVWAIVYADVRHGVDLTSEPGHTILGLLTFAGALALAASTDALFAFVLPTLIRGGPDEPERRGPSTVPTTVRNVALGVGLVVFLGLSLGMFRSREVTVAEGNLTDASLMPTFDDGSMPSRIGLWQRADHRRIERDPSNAFGLISETFTYANGDEKVLISLDGPYDSWHDLGYCYGAIDWQLRDSQNIDLATAAGETPMRCVELNLYRGEGDRALVMYTAMDSLGRVVDPPASHGSVLRNLTNRLGISDAQQTVSGEPAIPPIYQVQLFVEGGRELSPEVRASIDRLYDVIRRRMTAMLGSNDA